jgi:hypothetical protein
MADLDEFGKVDRLVAVSVENGDDTCGEWIRRCTEMGPQNVEGMTRRMGPSGAAASEVARRDSFLHAMCCNSCGGP